MCKVWSHCVILRTADEKVQRNVRNEGWLEVPSMESKYQEVRNIKRPVKDQMVQNE